ncbi:GntR family transcriptional regulator [Pseudonocardia sediminis]|uniref:GntR family transcriptional regulator n=1 Tax=Pseudonocardia sediminis TaxID=1397368 RepID=A0A4Q7UV94_PSEST|nr:PLP-dependent aminotransferase family protein [Pseudonocardia sediminis]RZT85695.1 GntR family transcriptional regulator [Pseudonocardia sediminis]
MQIGAASLAAQLGDWRDVPEPAHRALANRLRLLVQDGRLPLSVRLPGERDLAAAVGVSRTTVGAAYAALREEGYLSSRERSRSAVRLPRGPTDAEHADTGSDTIDLSVASSPAPGPFLADALGRAMTMLARHLPRVGYDLVGIPELRAAVADRFTARGVPTTPGQIMVTSGAQHALSLLVRTLAAPRDRVLVDHPTYPQALAALSRAAVRISPVALRDGGWDLPALADASRGCALAYLVPDFHNPTGYCMDTAAREALRLGCPVIVDETLAELALDIDPPAPVAAFLPEAITIGSLSKVVWGGLRVGWIRAATPTIQRLTRARATGDLGTSVIDQLVSTVLLEQLDSHLPHRRDELRGRRAHLLQLLGDRFPSWTVSPGPGGLSLWVGLDAPISSALAAAAPDHGLRLAAGPRFGLGGAFERHLRLPYGLPEPLTTEAFARLRSTADDLGARRTRVGPSTPAV